MKKLNLIIFVLLNLLSINVFSISVSTYTENTRAFLFGENFEKYCSKSNKLTSPQRTCLIDGKNIVLNSENITALGTTLEPVEDWLWITEAAKKRMPLMLANKKNVQNIIVDMNKKKKIEGSLAEKIDNNISSHAQVEVELEQAKVRLKKARMQKTFKINKNNKNKQKELDDSIQKESTIISYLAQMQAQLETDTPVILDESLKKYREIARKTAMFNFKCNDTRPWHTLYGSSIRGGNGVASKGLEKVCKQGFYKKATKAYNDRFKGKGDYINYFKDIKNVLVNQLGKTNKRIERYNKFLSKRNEVNELFDKIEKGSNVSESKKLINDTIYDTELIGELLLSPELDPAKDKETSFLIHSWCRLTNRVLTEKANDVRTDFAVDSALTVLTMGAGGALIRAGEIAKKMGVSLNVFQKTKLATPLLAADAAWAGYDFTIRKGNMKKECKIIQDNMVSNPKANNPSNIKKLKECLGDVQSFNYLMTAGNLLAFGINIKALRALRNLDVLSPGATARKLKFQNVADKDAFNAARKVSKKENEEVEFFLSTKAKGIDIEPTDREFVKGAYVFLKNKYLHMLRNSARSSETQLKDVQQLIKRDLEAAARQCK